MNEKNIMCGISGMFGDNIIGWGVGSCGGNGRTAGKI